MISRVPASLEEASSAIIARASNCCFVYGIEIDLGGMDAGGKDHPLTSLNDGHITTVRVKDEGSGFYGDVTGRLGYTWGSALLYAKGGFAWLNTNLAAHEADYAHERPHNRYFLSQQRQ